MNLAPEPLRLVVLALALLLMFAGVLGTLLPVLPGPVLILLAALGYAWFEGFGAVGWPTLVAMGILTLLAISAEAWASGIGAKVGGASAWSVLAGMLTGLAGLLLFSLPGSIVGAVVGVLLSELIRLRQLKGAFKASSGWLLGWLLSTVVRLAIAMVMVALFAWRVICG